jgi:hypothetical protein
MSGAAHGLLAACSSAPGAINAALPDSSDVGTAGITFQNDGDYLYDSASQVDWVTPSDATTAAFYELQVNVNSGTIDSGTVDSWLALSTSRAYGKTAAGTAVLRIRIREVGSGIVRTDQTVSIVVS